MLEILDKLKMNISRRNENHQGLNEHRDDHSVELVASLCRAWNTRDNPVGFPRGPTVGQAGSVRVDPTKNSLVGEKSYFSDLTTPLRLWGLILLHIATMRGKSQFWRLTKWMQTKSEYSYDCRINSPQPLCVCVCRQVGSLLKLTLVNLSFQATISCRHGFWGHYCCFSTKKSLKKPRFPQVTKTQKAFGCSDVNGEEKGWPFLLTANSWEWWPLCVRCIRHVPPWKPVQSAFWENLTRKWAKPHWISERKGSWPPHARLTIGLFLCLQFVCAIDFFKKKKSLERAE